LTPLFRVDYTPLVARTAIKCSVQGITIQGLRSAWYFVFVWKRRPLRGSLEWDGR